MTRPTTSMVRSRGHRGDHRADREAGQADLQHQLATEAVRRPAQQRHRRDVAEQIPVMIGVTRWILLIGMPTSFMMSVMIVTTT